GVNATDFLAAAGAGRDGRVPFDPDLHELAADTAAGTRWFVLGTFQNDDTARNASGERRGAAGGAREENETNGGARRGLSHGRSDGDRARRGTDSAGRSEPRRRFAGARAKGAAKYRGRNRHPHAESSHSR